MSAESRLVDLLVQFEESKERGQEITPEALCRDCPELLPELQRALQAVARVPRPDTVAFSVDDSTVQGLKAARLAESVLRETGRYTVVRPHAKGGLGEVLVARDQELQREVAFKRMLPRLASHVEARRRFLREAEVTARLEHPGVVPIYGLVEDSAGQPCYAMRFVQGESLSDAIQQFHQAPQPWDGVAFRQLLQRFLSVCQTMAYAHSRGVLHRDLKPANVMLGRYGETLVVDWGLAKLMDQAGETDGSLVPPASEGGGTVMGHTFGTPAYMSPEQAAGRWDEVGTSSDIYSLGATLYELLTGQRPVQGQEVRELIEKVKRGEYSRPRAVRADVPRPLDAICMKAMALAPEARYGSASALAEDLEHWLADEPVAAYAEPRITRMARWARKHPGRVGVVATGLLVTILALAAGLGVVSHFNSELDKANTNLNQTNVRLDRVNSDLTKSNTVFQTVSGILAEVSKEIDPRRVKYDGESLKVQLGKRLESAAAALEAETGADPVAVALLQSRIGISLIHLGHNQRAAELLSRARQTYVAHLGDRHEDSLNATHALVNALRLSGRLEESLALAEETLRLRKSLEGSNVVEVARDQMNLGWAYHERGWNDRALPLLEEGYRVVKEHNGPEDGDTLIAMNNLAVVYLALGRREEAVPLTKDLLEKMRRKKGPKHPDTIGVMNTLASAYLADNREAEALALVDECYHALKERLGPEHPDVLVSLNNLAFLHLSLGNHAKSLPFMTEAHRLSAQKQGPEHPKTLMIATNLGVLYQFLGRAPDAVALLEKTLKSLRAHAGGDHTGTMYCVGNLGNAYMAVGRPQEGMKALEESLRLRKASLGLTHHETLTSMNDLALAYTAVGRQAEAIKLHQETLQLRRTHLGPHHRHTLHSLCNLGSAYRLAGRAAEAAPLLEEGLKLRKAHLGPEHVDTLLAMNELGVCYGNLGRLPDSVRIHTESLPLHKKVWGPNHRSTLMSQSNLAVVRRDLGQLAEALDLGVATYQARRQSLGPNDPDTLFSQTFVANLYRLTGRVSEGLALLKASLEESEKKLGPEAPATVQCKHDLGITLLLAEQPENALPYLTEALPHRRKLLGPDHIDVMSTEAAIAMCYYTLRQYAKAEPLLRELIARQRASAVGVLTLAEFLSARAFCLLELEQYSEAEKAARECLAIRQKALPDAWGTFNARSLVGGSLAGQKKYAEAEPFLLEGYQGMIEREAKIPPLGRRRPMEALERLVSLYDKWGKADQAAAWRKKLSERQANSKTSNKGK